MTNEEAIEILRKFKPCEQGFCNGGIELLNNLGGLAMELAIKALKKQIPKKPLPEERYYGIGKCPSCNAVFLDKSTKFCGNCGQALNFSD